MEGTRLRGVTRERRGEVRNKDAAGIRAIGGVLTALGLFTFIGPDAGGPMRWVMAVLGPAAAAVLVRYGVPVGAETADGAVLVHFPLGRRVNVTPDSLGAARVQVNRFGGRSVILRPHRHISFAVRLSGWDQPQVLAQALSDILRAARPVPDQDCVQVLQELAHHCEPAATHGSGARGSRSRLDRRDR
jgi:hypothetical protein